MIPCNLVAILRFPGYDLVAELAKWQEQSTELLRNLFSEEQLPESRAQIAFDNHRVLLNRVLDVVRVLNQSPVIQLLSAPAARSEKISK